MVVGLGIIEYFALLKAFHLFFFPVYLFVEVIAKDPKSYMHQLIRKNPPSNARVGSGINPLGTGS